MHKRYFKGLVFGPHGHGKTILLSTAQDDPRTSPTLFLDFEGGTSSIADRGDIEVRKCSLWDSFWETYAMLASGDHPYKSVVVDSISEINTAALLRNLKMSASRRSNPDLLERQDYLVVSTQMRRLIRNFRDLPMHVMFSALVKDDTDPREGLIKMPLLSGKLATEIPGMLEVVGYLALAEVDEGVERVLLLKGHPKFRTKVRAPVSWDVPDEIVNPTMADILDIMRIPHEEVQSDTTG